MKLTSIAAALALAAAGLQGAIAPLAAADFYKGKQIQLVVGSTPGGVYDVYARLVAEHLGKHIPGQPPIVVQNMAGASGLKSAIYLNGVAPRDGTVILSTLSSMPTAPLFTPDAANFDVNKFSWIGSVSKDPFVGYVWHTAPIKALEDAKTTEVIMGGNSVGAAGVDMAIIARDFFGLKIKIVTGYAGAPEVKLAIESGEIHGTFANAWGDLKTQRSDWIREGKIRLIVQHGFEKHPDLPNVPLFMDLAKTAEDRQALELLLARQEFSKPYIAPPGVPAERVEILRRAFDATMKDPAFLASVQKARLAVDGPMTGEQLAAMVARLSATPQSIVQRIEQAFTNFNAGK